MRYLEWLEKAVGERLSSGAIGPPVFVRADLQVAADHGLLGPLAGAAVESAVKWLNASVHSIYALGGAKAGTVTVMVECTGGQSALLSADMVWEGDAAAQLLIIGQKGTLRLDDFPEVPQLKGSPAAGKRWHDAIVRSIETGKPVTMARG